jgi:putative transposase
MPRIARVAPGGLVYHVLNRANGRLRLFKKDDDFLAFEEVLALAHERLPIRILDWVMMSNHWHLVLWPERDGELTSFLRWLTLTHAQRWKHAHDAVGHGHLYQGRFKSFPIQDDGHLLTALRYVERNPLRANLVERAGEWRWGSCFVRRHRGHPLASLLSPWPIDRPRGWLELVNQPQTAAEENALTLSIERSRPLGSPQWVQRTAERLRLQQSLRPRGRPTGWRQPKSKLKRTK